MAIATAPEPVLAPTSAPSRTSGLSRIASVDIVRGVVMVLMAIDHVRVYAGVPAGGPTPGLFFTRWVTHFCAPAFVFLAGTSAYLYAQRVNDKGAVSRWLLTRGAWLVLLELTVLRFAWTFNFDYANYMLGGVIWMIGWCMILTALVIHLPMAAITALGLLIAAGHNLIGFVSRETIQPLLQGDVGWIFRILYFGGGLRWFGSEDPNFLILYSLLPWVGVMALGWAFGAVLRMDADRRRRWCVMIGATAIVAFVGLRYAGIYGDRPWSPPDGATPMVAFLTFLGTTKYPASLLFLLMTLGPTILVMPWLENARGRLAQWMTVFGRVPFFYYMLHIPLIHLVALGISFVRTPEATPWLFENHPLAPGPAPDGYRWSLGLLYLVTTLVVVVLYFPCRWFAELKKRRKDAWLSYL